MELWDIYDIDRQPTGGTSVRGEALGSGEYHMVVHLGIFNSEGFLRSWESTLISAIYGQSSPSISSTALTTTTSYAKT